MHSIDGKHAAKQQMTEEKQMTTLAITKASILSRVIGDLFTAPAQEKHYTSGDAIRAVTDVEIEPEEVIYYIDGWNLVGSSELDAYWEEQDFTGCKSATDCVMREANNMVANATYAIAGETAAELGDLIEKLWYFDFIDGFKTDSVELNTDYGLGNVAHDFEEDFYFTEEGRANCCVYVNRAAVVCTIDGYHMTFNLVPTSEEHDEE